MTVIRELLSQDPMTFNDLLDLFEGYLASVPAPLHSATALIHEELNYRDGDIFSHIIGVADDAGRMATRLRQVRAARNAGTDVTITQTREGATKVGKAADEAQYLLTEAAAVFGLLHGGIADGYLAPSDNGVLAVMSLAGRALQSAADQEGERLADLARKIRTAEEPQHSDQEEAA